MPVPDIQVEFDLSVITPGLIKRTLQKCSSTSSPGSDGITYFHLRNLPCTHHFLATVFSKILLFSQSGPSSWFHAEIILIPKEGDPSQPSNFRPIALTSAVSKLFHKILAKRLQQFLLNNNIINPTLQKGFLSGMNGTVEHIFSICSILDNAIQHGLPLAMSFLDLRNAFGSVSHLLIRDIFHYVQLPSEFTTYVTNSYSQLVGSVKTKKWRTPNFEIQRGVLQGDTLSPLIFLLAFNPLIELCNRLPSCGFNLRLPVPNSSGLPPTNTAIYVEWNEDPSDEPSGWYYAVVKEYLPNGQARIEYTDHASETLDLHSVRWEHTRKGTKAFLPLSTMVPKFPLKRIREEAKNIKICSSAPHTVKGFADDITVISSSVSAHTSALQEIDQKASSLDLVLKVEKCVSFLFDGKSVDKKSTVPLSSGSTRNISEAPWKVLGHLIAVTPTGSRKTSAKKLESKLLSSIKKIDSRPIRGEFKIWILKNYLAPSLYFLLMVDLLSEKSLVSIQQKLTKFIKKWLNLPRCCTLATIYHPDVLKLPFLPQYREHAKLSMVSALEATSDPAIKECLSLLSDPKFLERNNIPRDTCLILDSARKSISSLTKIAIKRRAKEILRQRQAEIWNASLTPLLVQSKFKDIILLEPQSHIWNRLLAGLPAGQLSFLIRAGADCLPTPLNLRRWHYRVCSKCPLCNSPNPTSAHILNGCQEALVQGRYTWRHDSILNCLLSSVHQEISASVKLYGDIRLWRASDSPPATLPMNISTTRARPDVVLIDNSAVRLLELTVPTNTREALQAARIRKLNKPLYLQLISDLEERGLSVSFRSLEIGSLGHHESFAVKCLADTFDLSKKLSRYILSKLSKISIACSFHIFNSRNSLSWDSNKPLYTI